MTTSGTVPVYSGDSAGFGAVLNDLLVAQGAAPLTADQLTALANDQPASAQKSGNTWRHHPPINTGEAIGLAVIAILMVMLGVMIFRK